MKCWLCERSDFAPGEAKENLFGDMECIYCTGRINFIVFAITHPETAPVIRGIKALPKVDGLTIGFRYEEPE